MKSINNDEYPWKAKGEISELADIQMWKDFVKENALLHINGQDIEENKFDCADFVITMVVEFFKKYQAEFEIKNIYGKVLNSSTFNGSYDDFLEAVKIGINASWLKNNFTYPVDRSEAQTGDTFNNGGHVQMILEKLTDEKFIIVQASGAYYGRNSGRNSISKPTIKKQRGVSYYAYRFTFVEHLPKSLLKSSISDKKINLQLSETIEDAEINFNN